MNSYHDLDIYKISLSLFYEVHPASLLLPKYELYELGSQLRKRYKADFIRFLVFSHSSCLETKNHLEKIDHLYKGIIPNNAELITQHDILGAKIFNFIKYVEENWKT